MIEELDEDKMVKFIQDLFELLKEHDINKDQFTIAYTYLMSK